MFKYPEGVTREEGDPWFLETHVPELLRQKGLWRFFSYQVVQEKISLPGAWPEGHHPPRESIMPRWDRVCELWYENFADWHESVLVSPPAHTAPPWASHPRFPFLKPGVDFVSTFIPERPSDEFLAGARSYL
jgi:hypothetical protein